MTYFGYNYKLSIIEDVYNIFFKTMELCNKGVVWVDPPPQLWSKTIFWPVFFTLPLLEHNYISQTIYIFS